MFGHAGVEDREKMAEPNATLVKYLKNYGNAIVHYYSEKATEQLRNSKTPLYRKEYDEAGTMEQRGPRSPKLDVEGPSEERDNDPNNPDWQDWKKERSDEELKRAARDRFGNREFGDPARCLTFHGYRRSQNSCHDGRGIYNPNIRDFRSIRLENGRIKIIHDNKVLKRKREEDNEFDDKPQAKRPRVEELPLTTFQYENLVLRAIERYKRPVFFNYGNRRDKKNANIEWKYHLRHFKRAMREMSQFSSCYSNNQLNPFSTADLSRSVCLEEIFNKFTEIYGPNPSSRCKDCTAMEKKVVNHPY